MLNYDPKQHIKYGNSVSHDSEKMTFDQKIEMTSLTAILK
jgi:hypothetical protein